jgi:hypothetical protein
MEINLPVLPEGFEWSINKRPLGALLAVSIYEIETTKTWENRRITNQDVFEYPGTPMQLLSEVFIGLHDELIASIARKARQARLKTENETKLEEFTELMKSLR